jgi:hypothetical protein
VTTFCYIATLFEAGVAYHSSVIDLYNDVQSKKNYYTNDVWAEREYVASYVHFIHYVEEISGGEPENNHME